MGDLAQGTTSAVVAMAAGGDRVAFTRLVEAYYDDTMRLAFVVTGGDRELARDAVQAAWSIAWQKLARVREPDRVKGWLLAVVANEARQAARRNRRHPVVEIELAALGPSGPDPSQLVGSVDLRRALGHLSPDDRALLALRYVAGLDSSEISALTHRPASSVRGRLGTLLARLRKELSDD